MNADIKGALNQIDRSYKAFTHKGKPMSKDQVKTVLTYGIGQGYEHTGQLTDEAVDRVLESLRKRKK